jgi:pSer/pThr/pTyr-binding forkhead associated (FHA) protein
MYNTELHRFELHDLGSTNGTLVRSEETDIWKAVKNTHLLSEGDAIRIGESFLRFKKLT